MVQKVSQNPYTSPTAAPLASPPKPHPTMAQSSFRYGALGLVISTGLFGAIFVPGLRSLVPLGVLVVLIMSLIGAGLGLFALGSHALGKGSREPLRAVAGIAMNLMAAAVSTAGMMLIANFIRGRQLRRWGKLKFAHLSPRTCWSSPPSEGARAPEAIAAAWRKNGLTEHASIAAFSHLCAELIALGAPPALIETSQRDALDELEHTKLCFALARQLDGQDLGPGRFAEAARPAARGPRALRLSRLAVESLVDGAINEGISARVIAQLSKSAKDERVVRVLRTIARDEARHAAHGFQVVRWCLQEGGQPVALTLAKTIAKLPDRLGDTLHPGAADGRWERWGLPGHAREQRAYREVRARVVARTQRLLARA